MIQPHATNGTSGPAVVPLPEKWWGASATASGSGLRHKTASSAVVLIIYKLPDDEYKCSFCLNVVVLFSSEDCGWHAGTHSSQRGFCLHERLDCAIDFFVLFCFVFKVPTGLSLIQSCIYFLKKKFLFLNTGQYLDCNDKAVQIKWAPEDSFFHVAL